MTIPSNTCESPQQAFTLSQAQVTDLAVDVWRLERWLMQVPSGQAIAPVRYATRRIGALLRKLDVETVDFTGQHFDPGLAIEIVASSLDPALPPGAVIVDEMIAPLCLWRKKVVRQGQAVTRSGPKNSEI